MNGLNNSGNLNAECFSRIDEIYEGTDMIMGTPILWS